MNRWNSGVASPNPQAELSALRVFIALPVPDDVKRSLGELIHELAVVTPEKSVRWGRPEQIHLTLRFIGGVPESEVPAITEALQRACSGKGSIALKTSALGCFPHRRAPRVIWVGLDGDVDELALLAEHVTQRTARWGQPEERVFHPHLTLGRSAAKSRSGLSHLGKALAGWEAPPELSWTCRRVELIQSRLLPDGAQHTTLATIPLASEPRL